MAGFVADALAAVNLAMSTGGKVASEIGNIGRKIEDKAKKVREKVSEAKRRTEHKSSMFNIFKLIGFVLLLGKCFMLLGDLVVKLFKWSFEYIGWFFRYFLIWFFQFTSCSLQKLLALPKCFLWYGLDTIGWIFYLPFRFIFWLLDQIIFSGVNTPTDDLDQDGNRVGSYGGPIVTAEHTMWKYMFQFDNFVHTGMGTGIHLFHFPDSVQETCYFCKIKPLKDSPKFPFKEINKFMKCILTPF
jgi:hypothetical protein